MAKDRESNYSTTKLKIQNHVRHESYHAPRLSLVRLLWASAINVTFALVECIGGILSNSLALISDAVHNLADSISIVVAYIAGKAALKPPTSKYTFGFRRFETLAALCNAVILFVVYGFIFLKAFNRLHSHTHIDSRLLLLIAGVGMVAKLIAMLILRRPSRGSLNVRAAYMHLLADLLSSLTVILGGIVIHFWHTAWIDSLITFCVGAYILLNTWPILRECVRILMQAAPNGINTDAITRHIEATEEIKAIRNAHLWQLAENDTYFAARIMLRPTLTLDRAQRVMAKTENSIKQRFNVQHVLLALDTSEASSINPGRDGFA